MLGISTAAAATPPTCPRPARHAVPVAAAADHQIECPHESGPLANGGGLPLYDVGLEAHDGMGFGRSEIATPSALDLFWEQLCHEPEPSFSERPGERSSRSRAGTPEPTRNTRGRLSPDSHNVPAFNPDGHMSRSHALKPAISTPSLVPPIPHPASPLVPSVVDFSFQASMLPRIMNAVATGAGVCFLH
jgi:hypothetical protein